MRILLKVFLGASLFFLIQFIALLYISSVLQQDVSSSSEPVRKISPKLDLREVSSVGKAVNWKTRLPEVNVSLAGLSVLQVKLLKERTGLRGNLRLDHGVFRCDGNSVALDLSSVNDNYCDCADHSDEPATSACYISICLSRRSRILQRPLAFCRRVVPTCRLFGDSQLMCILYFHLHPITD